MSLTAGLAAEETARQYLITQGLTWVESNFRCRLGEIDLVMRDKDYWVFVEVRARTSSAYGSALESVHYRKQQKLLKTASFYLTAHKLHNQAKVRFDVISIEGKKTDIRWISNAFGA
jgi:putative endonuclease